MAKPQSHFVCQSCGVHAARWLGRCTGCGEWNTLVEEISGDRAEKARRPSETRALPISEVAANVHARTKTGIVELDRVLGGGLVAGGITLLGGDPGVGKSTLLLQALAGLATQGIRTLYVSGEESAGQTAARAKRLSTSSTGSTPGQRSRKSVQESVGKELYVLAESELDRVFEALDEVKPTAVVIDSVQTVRSSALESAAGTVSQLREVAHRLVDYCKRKDIAAFLVGHVTKDGSLAGPKVLEHLVDTVLAFEGERGQAFRTLRALKNRFGSATEVGVFEMTEDGMTCVENPSALFLAERSAGSSGSVICATCEGSRPMLVEVQALVSPYPHGSPRRTAVGVDSARLAMTLAILERKAGLGLTGCDVFVSVAGGLRVDEPAADLAIALALASSLRDRPVPPNLVAFGELGLSGEVRSVPRAKERIAEARELGFTRAVLPLSQVKAEKAGNLIVGVRSVVEALAILD